MTDWDKLDEIKMSRGFTDTSLSIATGHSHGWLHNKRKRNADFTSTEMTSLCIALNLDSAGRDGVFFANNVDLKSTSREETA